MKPFENIVGKGENAGYQTTTYKHINPLLLTTLRMKPFENIVEKG